jgi:hypothetical protein
MAQTGRRVATINDPKVKLLIQALQGGNYIEHACHYADLHPSTVYRWLERGRNEKQAQEQGNPETKSELPYVELCDAIEKARASAIVANVTIIQQAARNGQWQAAAWWLERSLPNQYGRKVQAEVSGTVNLQELEQKMLAMVEDDDSSDVQEA